MNALPSAPPERVLVAVDGSPASLQAGRLAVTLAASWRASVRTVAVQGNERAERLVDRVGGGSAPARERRRAALEDALAHLAQFAAEAGVTVECVVRVRAEAKPYEVILEEVDRWRADVLVVGRGGHRGIGRALLGSQTEHVLEFATLPVIVVPAQSGRAPRPR